MIKQPDADEHYLPSYDCTLLTGYKEEPLVPPASSGGANLDTIAASPSATPPMSCSTPGPGSHSGKWSLVEINFGPLTDTAFYSRLRRQPNSWSTGSRYVIVGPAVDSRIRVYAAVGLKRLDRWYVDCHGGQSTVVWRRESRPRWARWALDLFANQHFRVHNEHNADCTVDAWLMLAVAAVFKCKCKFKVLQQYLLY